MIIMLPDVLYFSTLTASIIFGSYYKEITDITEKRYYGVALGLLIVLLNCGRQLIHAVIMVLTNFFIMNRCDKSYFHKVCLAYTWFHLLYLHINLINEDYVIWIHQVIALRLVGMAFEIYMEGKDLQENIRARITGTIFSDTTTQKMPSMGDIVAYAFFFIGLHKGPYFRWAIYKDHIKGSFGILGNCRIITEQKIKKALICVVSFTILRAKYSPTMYNDDSFYSLDADTRYLYNIPMLVIFYLKNQIIILLCTAVCTEAGFGVYPTRCFSRPGHGPTANLSLLKLVETPDQALNEEFNFTMLKCFDSEKLMFGPRMIDTLKSWDMSTQYWFTVYIYKGLFRTNKEIRSVVSFLTYTFWNGPSMQHIIVSTTLWVYVHLEVEYSHMYNTVGSMKIAWDIGFSIMRLLCLFYLTPCFVSSEVWAVLRFYNSIFWIFHGILILLIVGAFVSYKSRNS